MARFTKLPERLREVAEFDAEQRADFGNWLAASGVMKDAALKIEALERDLMRLREDRPFITGWNDGFNFAIRQAADEVLEENARRLSLASIRVPAMACEIREAILKLKIEDNTGERT
ncbi:MAG: hypothetical protein AAFQ38_16375 [Pseudomonadota bacterium]